MICSEHGEKDRMAEKHTKDTHHPTMTSIHPRPAVDTDDLRFHEVPE